MFRHGKASTIHHLTFHLGLNTILEASNHIINYHAHRSNNNIPQTPTYVCRLKLLYPLRCFILSPSPSNPDTGLRPSPPLIGPRSFSTSSSFISRRNTIKITSAPANTTVRKESTIITAKTTDFLPTIN
ncbi:hypothetical protein BJ508DRAFT_333917 [Ascobolus immersus RN42]|uniref:Uncharacterized protein n=1 Tax=Ascobolus immersus RN42 TaxID=1160509 RepID=A0A3N4HP55_ASCIM|nr:hypothetical protein BJ508DRAFT_333917 [Ascobolus immersus RN42]